MSFAQWNLQGHPPIRIKALPEAASIFRRFIQCTGCELYNYAPAFLCSEGHPTCEKCSLENDYCPYIYQDGKLCHKRWKVIPMDIYKYLHNESLISCPNYDLGCSDDVYGRDLEFHLSQKCFFRTLQKCPISSCSMTDVILSEYHDHLSLDHYIAAQTRNPLTISYCYDVGQKDETDINYKVKIKPLAMMESFGARFVVLSRDSKSKVQVWISMITGQYGKEYMGTLELIHSKADSTEEQKSKLYGFPIRNIHIPEEDIVDECECLDIHRKVLEDAFVEKDDEGTLILNMTVLIKEMSAESTVDTAYDTADDTAGSVEDDEENEM